jgi:endonuclease/exonuclease/phosphatase family metal-dependent hydrolase
MILAGDFNCILDTVDSTGHKNFSRALSSIVSGYRLHHVWDASRSRHGYTYYAPRTASRLDRIYVTQLLLSRKQGVETTAAAFTDHLAVVLRMAIEKPIPSAGRGY